MRFIDLLKKPELYKGFINNIKHINVHNIPEMFEVFNRTSNHSSFIFGVLNKRNEIIGSIAGVIIKNYFWPLSIFTSRAIIQGGAFVKNDKEEIYEILYKNLVRSIWKKCIYIQIRNHSGNQSYKNVILNAGFRHIEHLNIIIDLSEDWENIQKRISKNKRRNVTKSINKGVLVTKINDFETYKDALNLIYSTYQRIKLPLPNKNFFYNAFEILSEKGILQTFIAKYNDRIIGVRLELMYNETIYDWYAGSDYSETNKYPNDILVYHIINWGNKNGYKCYDFGGAGSPYESYGVREYKMKFGGKIFETGRYEIINNRQLYYIGKIGLNIMRFFRNVIP